MKYFKFCLIFVLCVSYYVSGSSLPFLEGRNVRWSKDAMKSYAYSEREKSVLKNTKKFFTTVDYFTVNAQYQAKLFTMFVEAKNGAKDAPIILWLQGGPGCSSLIGNFVEMGPYYVDKQTLELKERQFSWNNKYHMIFIDQPVNTGFSTSNGYYVHNQEQVADDLYNALTQFFAKYPQYAKNDFYIFGESYGGKYVPSIGYKIAQEGLKLNLKGIGVGDGLTDPINQLNQYSGFSYATGLVDENQRDKVAGYEKEGTDAMKAKDWAKAFHFWNLALETIQSNSGLGNPYDIRELHPYDDSEVDRFLNSAEVKSMLNTTVNWAECDGPTYEHLSADIPQSVAFKIAYLLDHSPVRVCIYQGNFDLIITLDGTQQWVRELNWSGQAAYKSAPRSIWKVDGDVAGWVRKTKNLSQVIVHNAGHMSPFNQPKNVLDMVTKFIEGTL